MSDIPALHALIEASVRGLQADDYTPAQIEGALGTVLGLDTQLIRDQTYFVVDARGANGKSTLAGCGGWSKRKTLFGSDHASVREPDSSILRTTPPKSEPSLFIPLSPGVA
jgi:hypothetical protein